MTEGENGSAFLIQTINGVRYKTWSAGIGAGLDYYFVRSIPLFLDLRKDILNKKNTPFVYADGGINYVWETSKDKSQYIKKNYNSTPFYDVGIGYKTSLGKQNALLLSLGFSQKLIKEQQTTTVYYYYTDFYPYPIAPVTPDRYSYTLDRLSLKLGWQF